MQNDNFLWWHGTIIYQIYPRSFQDSNNDGIGDLKGIIQRLDYLKWLGIETVWLSPIFSSPMADFGYDIADYRDIHPIFGTLSDFDQLLDEVHSREMKLILDLVPNHTSDQHSWFKEARSSINNPKRDWYIWQNANSDGSVPNNWLSVFGGSAWEWDEHTQQYYYHGFLKEQPDLNWRNQEVQDAMFDIMRFWLDKGVDGFRVDVIWHMIKDQQLRDNPPNPDYQPHMPTYDSLLPVFSTDQPEVHDIILKMRRLTDSYHARLIIGEVYLPIHKLMTYYGTDLKGAHLPFNFTLLAVPWNAQQIALAIDAYEGSLPVNGWPNWVLGNHDQARIASRIGVEQIRVAAMLLLTLRGTPTLYYGDEIGMKNVSIPFEEIQDPQGLNMPDKNLSRDPARTPMQWNDQENAGFSHQKPWLRLDDSFAVNNVAAQSTDNNSLLILYKNLISFRQQNRSLLYGNYKTIYADQQLLAYIRSSENEQTYLIILNLSHSPARLNVPNLNWTGTIAIATNSTLTGMLIANNYSVNGDEGIVVKLDQLNL